MSAVCRVQNANTTVNFKGTGQDRLAAPQNRPRSTLPRDSRERRRYKQPQPKRGGERKGQDER